MFSTYNEAVQYLGNKSGRPYPDGTPRSTRIIKTDRGIGVRYHDTVVVEYTPDGVILNTGGYYTVTTKKRMNDSLYGIKAFRVYQKSGVWYYNGFLYFDGMVIGYDGEIKNPKNTKETSEHLKEVERKQKLLAKYVKTLRGMLEDESLPAPSGGDCWDCCMVDSNGTPLGEVTNSDHLLSHLEESYIVPSLVSHIANTRGSQAMLIYLSSIWIGDRKPLSFYKSHTVTTLPNIVKRYFKDHLGI